MTIDEAIQHCEEVAEKQDKLCEISVTERAKEQNSKCASEHRQLAEWLRELKAYREQRGDAISRKSIKQKLQEHHDFFVNAYGGFSNLPQNDKSRVDEITNCIAMVVNEPSVTPQQRTGRWKFIVYDANRIGHYECTECHWNVLMNVSDYCPHCGAKMEVK